MAPRSALTNMSFTVDSASEDDMTHDELNTLPTPDSNTENKAPSRNARAKSVQSKARAAAIPAPKKGRPAARRTSGGTTTAAASRTKAATAPKASRKALQERAAANGSDTEEVEEFEDDVVVPAKTVKRGRPAKAQKPQEEGAEVPALPKKGRKPTAKESLGIPSKTKTAARAKPTKRDAVENEDPEHMIPETQTEPDNDPMDIEQCVDVDVSMENPPPPPSLSERRVHVQSSRTQQTSVGLRRAGSASDSERDPQLRRKVGDLTRKLEALTVKYEALKEAASSGKESTFDQLKKRTEQHAKDQDMVIKALKQQVAELQSRTSDLTSVTRELTTLSKENTRLSLENKKLADSLASAHNENKALSTKLVAARSSAQTEAKTVPGSAIKPRSTGVVLPGTAEAAKEAQLAKQKVDLYSDLTNLVILGAKKNEDEDDVYDCLQTGRNGTLHFHLAITAGSDSYEDTEFIYQPLLNEQRDKELLDLLPEYLTEEISFPRGQAARFYCKVVDSMSKKIILEEEE